MMRFWIGERAKARTEANLGPDCFQLILIVKLLD
jgi:hypothetical protein